MHLLKRFPALTPSSLVFGQRLIEAASVVVITALIARRLGLSALGEFSYALALLQLAVALAISGLEPVLVREIVAHPDRSKAFVGTAFIVTLLLGPVVALLPCAYIFWSHPSNSSLRTLALAASVSALPACLQVFGCYLRAVGRATEAAKGAIVGVLIGFTARAVALLLGAELYIILLLLTLDALIAGAFNFRAFRKAGGELRFDAFESRAHFTLVKALVPAALAGLTVAIFTRLNHILLAESSGMSELGKYALGYQALTLASLAPQAYLTVKYAGFVRLFKIDRAAFDVATRRLYVGLTAFSVLQAAFAYLFAGVLLPMIFGPAGSMATDVVILMVASAVFIASGALRSQLIYILDMPRLHVWNALVGLAVILLVGHLLIPRFGAEGAAISFAVGLLVSAILTSFLHRQTRDVGVSQILALLLIPRRRVTAEV